MEWLKSTWTKVAGALGVIIGLLLYYINLKNKQNAALQAKIDLADTQKKVDLIEVDIKNKLDNHKMLQKEVSDHEEALKKLEQKRTQIADQQKNLTSDQITDYWNKK